MTHSPTMKKPTCSLLFLFVTLVSFAQANLFTMQSRTDSRIEIQQVFTGNSILKPFTDAKPICGLAISGTIILHSDTSIVRVILSDDQNNEYLVLEANSLLTDSMSFSIEEYGEETALINNIIPSSLIVEVNDAIFIFQEITISRQDIYAKQAKGDLFREQVRQKIRIINENLENRNIPWIAGETSMAFLTYSEKKAYFGDKLPNLYGFEYYTGGIFVMPGVLETEKNTSIQNIKGLSDSPYVKEFSWRDVHGQNWVTPVKNQGGCGSCWAFAATGATELMVNLYYNRHLDLNLAEQQLVSCSGAGSCNGGWTYKAVQFIRDHGIAEEACFPYKASNISCSGMCSDPEETIKIGAFKNNLSRTIENYKKVVLSGAATIAILPWRHSIGLVGFKTLYAGDRVYVKSSTESRWVNIDSNSPLIGMTAWLIKNSWGTSWGSGGYAYVVTNMSDIYPNDPSLLAGAITSKQFSFNDIICTDNDGDGYYCWGSGTKPPHCPDCPDSPDGDDSDACFGPRDEYGNLQSFYAPEPYAGDKTIFEGEPVPDLTAVGEYIRWYSDYGLTDLVYEGASFATGHASRGIYTYYVTQTLSECQSPPKAVHLIILEGITPPTTEDVEVCHGDHRLLNATGENIRWYSDIALIHLIHEGNTYSPVVTETGIYDFYVTQTIEGIESPSATATYTIKQPPGPIDAEDKVFCSDEGLFMYAYGDSIKWYTKEFSDELYDARNGRTYKIVTIGGQVWMAENLDIGVQIQGSDESSDNGIIEKYYYNDDTSVGELYGGLYQWNEMMNYSHEEGAQGVCPDGWHIPTNDEWKILEMELGMSPDDVDVLGLRGTDQGLQLSSGGSSGFDALMAGKRQPDGSFFSLEYYVTYWNSSEYNRTISVFFDQIYASKSEFDPLENGYSVRCIMNDSKFVKEGKRLDVSDYETGEYTFRVTNTYEGCESDPDTVRLIIRDTPSTPIVDDFEFCMGKDVPILEAQGENIKWYPELPETTFIDERDNQEYKMVRIGNQVWMGQNLDYGVQIPGSQESANNGIIEKYYYNDDPVLGPELGGLYQWDELMNYSNVENTQGICPAGWDVPSNGDWIRLETELGMNQAEATIIDQRGTDQGTQLKAGGSSGFEALMAGKRSPDGSFGSLEYTTFWNSTGCNRTLSSNFDGIFASKSKYDTVTNGFSVRCIMNDSAFVSEGTHYYPEIDQPGIYQFSVTQTVEGCESDRAYCSVLISEKPLPPQGISLTICEGEGLDTIEVGGENISWYSDPGLDTLIRTGNHYLPDNLTPGTHLFYVTQSTIYCESDPALIELIIKPAPEEPLASDVSVCYGDTVPDLSALGEQIQWYGDPDLKELLHTGPEFATGMTDTGTYIYYITQTFQECESPVKEVDLKIIELPEAPFTNDIQICEGEEIPVLVGGGEGIRWYDSPDLIKVIYTGKEFMPLLEEPGSFNYFITQTVQGCEGPAHMVSVKIVEDPVIDLGEDTLILVDQSILLGPYPVEYQYLWSNTSTDPFYLVSGSLAGTGEHIISVQVSNSGCIYKDTIRITVQDNAGVFVNDPGEYIRVYPNPTSDIIYVQFERDISSEVRLELFESRGAIVQRIRTRDIQMIREHPFSIELRGTGIYYLIISIDENTYHYKVVKL